MTLSKELRSALRAKLNNISERQLNRHVHNTARDSGILDLDVAGLVMAHQLGITVNKPMYGVEKEDLQELGKFLSRQKSSVQVITTPSGPQRTGTKRTRTAKRVLKFLDFGDRYPDIFYRHLEQEINLAAAYGDVPSAVFVLSRKLIENLLYNLLQMKYGGTPQITKYFDKEHRRPLDLSVLIDNFGSSKEDFDVDQHMRIDKFLTLVGPFRENANSKAHNLLEYAESMGEVREAKVPEMVELLLKLIEASKLTRR